MQVTINKEGTNVPELFSLTRERCDEMVSNISTILDVKGITDRESNKEDMQEVFNAMESVATNDNEMCYMIYLFCGAMNEHFQMQKIKKMRNDFFASFLPQN